MRPLWSLLLLLPFILGFPLEEKFDGLFRAEPPHCSKTPIVRAQTSQKSVQEFRNDMKAKEKEFEKLRKELKKEKEEKESLKKDLEFVQTEYQERAEKNLAVNHRLEEKILKTEADLIAYKIKRLEEEKVKLEEKTRSSDRDCNVWKDEALKNGVALEAIKIDMKRLKREVGATRRILRKEVEQLKREKEELHEARNVSEAKVKELNMNLELSKSQIEEEKRKQAAQEAKIETLENACREPVLAVIQKNQDLDSQRKNFEEKIKELKIQVAQLSEQAAVYRLKIEGLKVKVSQLVNQVEKEREEHLQAFGWLNIPQQLPTSSASASETSSKKEKRCQGNDRKSTFPNHSPKDLLQKKIIEGVQSSKELIPILPYELNDLDNTTDVLLLRKSLDLLARPPASYITGIGCSHLLLAKMRKATGQAPGQPQVPALRPAPTDPAAAPASFRGSPAPGQAPGTSPAPLRSSGLR
uniref:Myosin_tail_1 domain-containing protein n=1 Tax=Caenorhabditis tropicalis TaxID=1561998 RepID=A0A1I7V3V3_9PELO